MGTARDFINKIDDLRKVEVKVDAWPGHPPLFIRVCKSCEIEKIAATMVGGRPVGKGKAEVKPETLVNARARMVAMCLVEQNADGSVSRVFTDEQASELGEKASDVLQMLFDKAMELNGLDKDEVSELSKPSGSETTSGSCSPSP